MVYPIYKQLRYLLLVNQLVNLGIGFVRFLIEIFVFFYFFVYIVINFATFTCVFIAKYLVIRFCYLIL